MTKPFLTDEMLLAMVRARSSGTNCTVIGREFGLMPEYVRAVTNRIRKADEAESGEDVSGAYW